MRKSSTPRTLWPQRSLLCRLIATEVAGIFIAIRIGFDQIVAPLAAEAHGKRSELVGILATTTRWSTVIALPLVVAIAVYRAPRRL